MTTTTQQRVFSIARQVLALAGVVMGVLTASVSSLHLPPLVSSILVVAGGVILAVEHYVADPTTGTPIQTITTTSSGPAPQPVPTLDPPHVAS